MEDTAQTQAFIKSLRIENFKSFGGSVVEVYFDRRLTGIIGPNGSGKSNVLDAICFVLGRLSAKSLRAKLGKELVYSSPPPQKGINDEARSISPKIATVEITIEESPSGRQTKIARYLRKKDGLSIYRLDGKRLGRAEVIDFLKSVGISHEGYNVVFQGDVGRFVKMSPLERRLVIDEIAGIAPFIVEENKLLNRAAEISRHIEQQRTVIRSRRTELLRLEADKKKAERAARLTELFDRYERTLWKRQLEKHSASVSRLVESQRSKESEISRINAALEESRKRLEESEESFKELDAGIREAYSGDQRLLAIIEREAAKKELQAVERDRDRIKDDLENAKLRLGSLKESHEAIVSRELPAAIAEIERIKTARASLLSEKQSLNEKRRKLLEGKRSEDKAIEDELERLRTQSRKLLDEEELLARSAEGLENQARTRQFELDSKTAEVSALKSRLGQMNVLSKELEDEWSRILAIISEKEKEQKKIEEGIKGLSARLAFLEAGAEFRLSTVAINEHSEALVGSIAARDGLNPAVIAREINSSQSGQHNHPIIARAADELNAVFLADCDLNAAARFSESLLDSSCASGVVRATLFYGSGKSASGCDCFALTDTLDEALNCGRNLDKKVTVSLSPPAVVTRTAGGGASILLISASTDSGHESPETQCRMLSSELKKQEAGKAECASLLDKSRRDAESIERRISELTDRTGIQKRIIELEDSCKLVLAERDRLMREKDEFECKASVSHEERSGIMDSSMMRKLLNSRENAVDAGGEESSSGKSAPLSGFSGIEKRLKSISKEDEAMSSQLVSLEWNVENRLIPERNRTARIIKSHEENEIPRLEKELSVVLDAERAASGVISRTEKLAQTPKAAALEKLIQSRDKTDERRRKEGETVAKIGADLKPLLLELEHIKSQEADIGVHVTQISKQLEGIPEDFFFTAGVNKCQTEMRDIKNSIEKMGSVNQRSILDYVHAELDFWEAEAAKIYLEDELNAVNYGINGVQSKKRDSFMKCFSEVAMHFSQVFETLMNGPAELVLESPERIFDEEHGGLLIHAAPAGKKVISTIMMSGGEKTMTALAFIFALQSQAKAPFCVLDEVEAALDKENSRKLARLYNSYAKESQIIAITHNDAVMNSCGQLLGIYKDRMSGVSRVISARPKANASASS